MDDLYEQMKTGDRQKDPKFRDDENLFRRVPPHIWDDARVDVAAIELPDISVVREKYCQPSWAILVDNGKHSDYGVIGFSVGDLPAPLSHQGIYTYVTEPAHEPLKKNYPHSEVQVSVVDHTRDDEKIRVSASFMEQEGEEGSFGLVGKFPASVYLRWREKLRRKCRILIKPSPKEAG